MNNPDTAQSLSSMVPLSFLTRIDQVVLTDEYASTGAWITGNSEIIRNSPKSGNRKSGG